MTSVAHDSTTSPKEVRSHCCMYCMNTQPSWVFAYLRRVLSSCRDTFPLPNECWHDAGRRAHHPANAVSACARSRRRASTGEGDLKLPGSQRSHLRRAVTRPPGGKQTLALAAGRLAPYRTRLSRGKRSAVAGLGSTGNCLLAPLTHEQQCLHRLRDCLWCRCCCSSRHSTRCR